MATLFAALLVLVPVPANDAPPGGTPPTLQYIKYEGGKFKTTATVTQMIPVVETQTVRVNGKEEARSVVKYVQQQKFQKVEMEAATAMVFTVDGKRVDEKAWQDRLGRGAVVLVSADGQVPDPAYWRVLREGTLIVVVRPAAPLAPPMLPPQNLPK